MNLFDSSINLNSSDDNVNINSTQDTAANAAANSADKSDLSLHTPILPGPKAGKTNAAASAANIIAAPGPPKSKTSNIYIKRLVNRLNLYH